MQLRPRAVLAVGITGHRSIGVKGPTPDALLITLEMVFGRLSSALTRAAVTDAALFSGQTPMLRAIGMAADGADLLGARAAHACGAEIGVVLPFEVDEYRKDFATAESAALLDEILSIAVTRFELPGSRQEGARAYERANEVILGNVDVLIAIWDGRRANDRAGTGDVVVDAVSRSIPLIAINPDTPDVAKLLVRPFDDELGFTIGGDLNWRALDDDLAPLVAGLLSPPLSAARRRGLVDLLAEPPRAVNWRIEYPMLLRMFGVSKVRSHQRLAVAPAAEQMRLSAELPQSSARAPDDDAAQNLVALGEITRYIDRLAAHYGQLFRSSAVNRFLVIVFVAFLSGMISILFPPFFGISLVLQAAVTLLVMINSTIGGKRRWHERWLDYRSVAERLRSLRFLYPLGIGPDISTQPFRSKRQTWTDWYVRRLARSLGGPTGRMCDPDIAAAARELVMTTIADQVAYHRRAFRQLGMLERRLAFAAQGALVITMAVAVALGISTRLVGSVDAVWWKPVAHVLLGALPAAMTAFNGIRADADLVRLVERSALTAAALARLRRAMASAPLTHDRLASAAIRVTSIMANELSEWRFVLESRRSRSRRRRAFR